MFPFHLDCPVGEGLESDPSKLGRSSGHQRAWFWYQFQKKAVQNSTGSKAHTMLLNIMAKASSKDLESLEAIIESFTLIREGKSPDDKKKTPHFLLNFLLISTIFASFSRAHARTLLNQSYRTHLVLVNGIKLKVNMFVTTNQF
jgi:hypothetical protein